MLKMTDSRTEETKSIRDSARSLKKYGSTCNHVKRQENCIKHVITEGETLQGIALKYGVTMEQIRRLNRLWASDSLFLREHLLIPVPIDTPVSPNNVILFDGHSLQSPITPESPSESHASDSDRSIGDFLVKIDTSIANTKSQVKKVQGNSEFVSNDGDDDGLYIRRKAARSRLRQQTNSLDAPHPVVMTSQNRHVRSSLQRLEKEQDEMFEL